MKKKRVYLFIFGALVVLAVLVMVSKAPKKQRSDIVRSVPKAERSLPKAKQPAPTVQEAPLGNGPLLN
jgi:hypothetical protein